MGCCSVKCAHCLTAQDVDQAVNAAIGQRVGQVVNDDTPLSQLFPNDHQREYSVEALAAMLRGQAFIGCIPADVFENWKTVGDVRAAARKYNTALNPNAGIEA